MRPETAQNDFLVRATERSKWKTGEWEVLTGGLLTRRMALREAPT